VIHAFGGSVDPERFLGVNVCRHARGTWARYPVERFTEAGYANGGVPPGIQPGIGGAAAGTVDGGGDADDAVRPRLGGDPGVVGAVVLPAPPSVLDEVVDDAAELDAVVGAAELGAAELGV
jgi:hypothetical protein